jgi:CBS domain-containing protein
MILVKHILDSARKRLAVLSREASLFDAARILANRDTPLVVVCDSDGIAVGVISSSHVSADDASGAIDRLPDGRSGAGLYAIGTQSENRPARRWIDSGVIT